MYRFKCKHCKYKYIGDTLEVECPKCGVLNQTVGKFKLKK